MKVSEATIRAIEKLVTGDPVTEGAASVAPYQKGYELVQFFNQFGFADEYGQGFGSRWYFVQEKLRVLNGQPELRDVLESILDPRRFIAFRGPIEGAVSYVNEYLDFDGFRVAKRGKRYCVIKASPGPDVEVSGLFSGGGGPNQEFIDEHLEKCDQKIREGDLSGAITNSRSLVETVLIELERKLSPQPNKYDGDLPRLYKRVQALLNLDPGRQDVSEAVRRILGGLANIVAGLAPIRNTMSDAHPLDYRPERHHAKLAVNAAKTLTDFLSESVRYQLEKGLIELPVDEG